MKVLFTRWLYFLLLSSTTAISFICLNLLWTVWIGDFSNITSLAFVFVGMIVFIAYCILSVIILKKPVIENDRLQKQS